MPGITRLRYHIIDHMIQSKSRQNFNPYMILGKFCKILEIKGSFSRAARF